MDTFKGHKPLEKPKTKLIREFINKWLQDPTLYCNYCGLPYYGQVCCDKQQVGNNMQHCWAVIVQNKARQKIRDNELATTHGPINLRLGVSIPEKLLRDLEKYFRETHKEKLWNNKNEFRSFLRDFPQFCIPEKI